MYVEIKETMAKITSVTPIMEKHGKKKKRPAHSIIFEFTMANTVLDELDDNGLREAFYRKPQKASMDPKTKQTKIDTSSVEDGISQLKFPWWQQWIDIPGELIGWNLSLHVGNTERSHIVLDDAKVSAWQVMPKDLAITLVKCKAIVHPTAGEKGRIDELLQTDVKISILPPQQAEQGSLLPSGEQGDSQDENTSEEGEQEERETQAAAASSEAPIEDPFAGSDLARGVVKSDAKVTTKKSRKGGPQPDGSWPFPSSVPSHA